MYSYNWHIPRFTYTHFGHDESQADENVINVNAASLHSETVSYTAGLWPGCRRNTWELLACVHTWSALTDKDVPLAILPGGAINDCSL